MLITCLLARLVPYGRLVWSLGSGSPVKAWSFSRVVSQGGLDWRVGGCRYWVGSCSTRRIVETGRKDEDRRDGKGMVMMVE